MRKTLLGLAAAAALVVPLATVAGGAASAAPGDQLIVNGDFSTSGPGGALLAPASTDFSLTTLFGQANNDPGSGSMWDPGTYVIGDNPNAFHALWADFGATGNPMMIVNGFQSTNQKVWSEDVAAPVCETAGSKVTYDFTANATNIVPAGVATDGGANIEVKVNGTSIGSQDLTGVNAGQVVQFVGAVPAAANMNVTIWNNGTAYSGNDFAIDNVSLVQRGDCEPPCIVTHQGVWFNYTGKFTGTGAPALSDPKWKALPAQPGGEHALSLRGFDQPYRPGVDKGKGDWFVWRDLGNTCPTV